MKKIILLSLCTLWYIMTMGQILPLSNSQKNSILSVHNFCRLQLGNDELVWSEELSQRAMQWLRTFKKKPLSTINTYNYEQNLCFFADTTELINAVKQWKMEQVYYNGDFSDSAKEYLYQHYYRIINPKFKKLGCAAIKLEKDWYALVCFYSQ